MQLRTMTLPRLIVPKRHMTLICLTLVACLTAYFAIRSALMIITEPNRLPVGDIWHFYTDFFKYLDGHYSFWHLFDRHNEHLILTTRLALFVDTIWFGASGKSVLIIAYFSALAIALMLAYLAAEPKKWEVAGLAAAFFGFSCARINLGNLTMPFHVGFFLVHVFALATLITFWRGLVGARYWYVLAFACDFMTVFSLGSGVLVGASAVALTVWAKKFNWLAAFFFVFHAALIIITAWLIIGPPGRPAAMPSTPTEAITYFVVFLGNFTLAWPNWPLPVGTSLAAICAGLFTWLTWRSVRAGIQFTGQIVVLAAFALFVILEAGAAAFPGLISALAKRYLSDTRLAHCCW